MEPRMNWVGRITRSSWPLNLQSVLGVPYSNTNGSPSANSTLTMITETKPIERKGWR